MYVLYVYEVIDYGIIKEEDFTYECVGNQINIVVWWCVKINEIE
jgi:hypothetical protein